MRTAIADDDYGYWVRVLTPAARRLWEYFQIIDGRTSLLLDVVRETGLSKTAIRSAVAELEGHGFVVTEVQ
jgi:hypothetical protein